MYILEETFIRKRCYTFSSIDALNLLKLQRFIFMIMV